ncbi:hypothetical protein Val02_57260 [Virgisporangium aliadipatigenens]|uniref:DUF2550 family protein n=1 Tax=Virgisporangium aliadipatigenens TaxID=741659 RepID=A0A8J3YRY0_9ACTN|nr:DUF2550 domain-containing protein [Virgisporangium aliadipatigenens]GIJ48840.1 hypothetical protein Val02_57260 [Virgisporangium aliadipatigenens]
MEILEWIGIGVLVPLAALLAWYFRRAAIARAGGTTDMSMRLTTMVAGRGWAHGLARFAGDELRWYRVFSLWPRPRRVFRRHTVSVQGRRRPDGTERFSLPGDWVIVRCTSENGSERRITVELAMAEATLTGFLSWIEAAPPGAASRRLATEPPH